jgi:regulator of sigma E protease
MIGGLILVHEFGHYIVARWMGVHVVEFAIGVGPKIWVKKGKQTRPDLPPTEYTIGALPFGGFVKMLGTDPHEVVAPEIEAVSFNARPVWRRFLVMIAGPAFNILLALVIYFCMGLFESKLPSSRVGVVDSNGAAWKAGLRPGDEIIAIDGDEVAYFWQVQDQVSAKYAEVEDPTTGESKVVGRPIELTWRHHGQVVTKTFDTDGVAIDRVPNLPGVLVTKRGQLGVTSDHVLPIMGVEEGSLAHKAGLRTWDRIIAVDGERVDQLSVALDRVGKRADKSVEVTALTYVEAVAPPMALGLAQVKKVVIEPSPGAGDRGLFSGECVVSRVVPGSPAEKVGVRRGDRIVRFAESECASWDFFNQRIRQAGPVGGVLVWKRGTETLQGTLSVAKFAWPHELSKEHTIGVHGIEVLAERASMEFVENESRLAYAWYNMSKGIGDAMGQTLSILGGLFSGRVAIKDGLGGPVLMGQLASKTTEYGWGYFFALMAGFSVSLGLLNLLPIPILDGGQILFLAIEGIRRKPVSLRVRMIATYSGLAFVIVLMIVVFRYDLERCW